MSERRFVIFETGADAKDFIEITELELKKRCVRMFNAKWSCAEDIRIDILLDGEQEQPWPGPVDIIEMRGKEQPKEKQFPKEQDLQKFDGIPAKNQAEIHKKQPDEWEEWAEAAAHVLVVERYDNTLNAQELKVKEVLFSIPCNPRRKL